ncbi:hypothetical protein GGS21DRAFT_448080 [Xylaria nigripes]|nr:hypothetical protein GGS21DRAFT_448080 [Xylaria nigripes]
MSPLQQLRRHMDASRSVDIKGIGEGLPIQRCHRSSSSNYSTISLSDDDQTISSHLATQVEDRSDTMTKLATDTKLTTKSCLVPSTTIRERQIFVITEDQANLAPLDRYYRDAQAHEELSVGQVPKHRSFMDIGKLDELQDASVRISVGSSRQDSVSSDPSRHSAPVANSHVTLGGPSQFYFLSNPHLDEDAKFLVSLDPPFTVHYIRDRL